MTAVKAKANMKAMKVADTKPAKGAAMKTMKVMKVKAVAEPPKGATMKAMKVKAMKAMKAMHEDDLNPRYEIEDRVWEIRYWESVSGDVYFKCIRCGRVGMARRRGNPTNTQWNCGHCGLPQPAWV